MNGDVLERNVRALLRASYVPALPTPAFRDRLESLVVAEVARRRLALRPGRGPRRLAAGLVALAAGLVAVLLGWRALAPAGPGPGTRAARLARGEVVLRLEGGTWRSASPVELAEGLRHDGAGIEVETPAERTFAVRAGSGVLHVAERSAVTVRGPLAAPIAELHRGTATWEASGDARALTSGVALELGLPGKPAEPAPEGAPREEAREPAALVAGAAEPAPGPLVVSAGLTGRVIEASSGDPVTRFTVGLLGKAIDFSPTAPVTRSFESEDGTFAWPDAPPGEQRVFVFAEDFVLAQLGPRVLPLDGPVEAALDPGFALRGSVLDPAGNPVPGALVLPETEVPSDMLILRDTGQMFWVPVSTRTRSDGRFVLAHLPEGPQTLRVTADGWAPSWVTLAVDGAASAPDVVVRLQPGGAIAGRVTGADGGPRADALMITMPMDASQGQRRAHFDMTRTGPDGSYRFEHVPTGSMIVGLTDQDGPPEVKPVRVREEETETVDFAARRDGTRLRGLLSGPDGDPIGLQNMALIDPAASEYKRWDQTWVATITDPDGRYVFDGIAPGTYQIFLIADQGRGLRMVDELSVPDEPEVLHDVRVAPARLELTVVDRRGAPEVGAILFLFRRDGQRWTFAGHGRTDGRGRGSFAGIRAGVYRVEACPTRDGLGLAWRDDVELTATEPAVSLTLELPEGGGVSGRVVDESGAPVAEARVLFRDVEDFDHSGSLLPFTDEAGVFQAFGLPPGEYKVRAFGPDGRTIERSFVKSPGIDPDLRLALPPSSEENDR